MLAKAEVLLLLPHLKVQNANLISSPMTWGFPAPQAFAGFAHALVRKMRARGVEIELLGVGIACHSFAPQIADGGYVKQLNLTRNPLGSGGEVLAIVEEGRAHMEISLVLKLAGEVPLSQADADASDGLAAQLMDLAEAGRIAGGSVLPNAERGRYPARAWVLASTEGEAMVSAQLKRRLAPSTVLVARDALLAAHVADMRQQQAEATTLDALLDLCALHHAPQLLEAAAVPDADIDPEALEPDTVEQKAKKPSKVEWTTRRREPGWLVPLPMGFGAISPVYEAGQVKNARDANVPFRFVESVIGLGEWKSPFAFTHFDEMLWHFEADPAAGVYRMRNHYVPKTQSTND